MTNSATRIFERIPEPAAIAALPTTETTMTPLKLQVEDLLKVIPQLSERDQGFAKSLCSQFLRKGLSANQAGWVRKRSSSTRPRAGSSTRRTNFIFGASTTGASGSPSAVTPAA